MRIRQIKPEFYLDDELAQSCSRDARLLFPGLWMLADREGRLEDRPAKIKAQIFPYDDDLTVKEIATLIDQLEAGGFVLRYTVNGRPLLWIRTFVRHQHCHTRESESQLPAPPKDIKKPGASTGQAPGEHQSSPSAFTSASTYGLRHTASGEAASQPARPAKGRRLSQKTGAPDCFEISEGLKDWASKVCPNLCITEETEKFLDHYRAVGGSFKDWDAAWRKWMRKALEIQGRDNGKRNAGAPQQKTVWDQLKEKNARPDAVAAKAV